MFTHIPRDVESILAFKREIKSIESQTRPDPGMHHCPFVGMIGDPLSTVGCLLHPLSPANNKSDFRGLSYWGGLACSTYFCLTHRHLPVTYKQILKNAMDDWYLYGLVVTDTEMINEFFTAVEDTIGRPLEESNSDDKPAFLDAVREFFYLKTDWPYRLTKGIDISNFSFGTQTNESAMGAGEIIIDDTTPFPAILKALNTKVEKRSELESALKRIRKVVEKAAASV